MTTLAAPGLRAGWLNAWLAAVGATALVDGLRLGWTPTEIPSAIFEHDGEFDIAALIAGALMSDRGGAVDGCDIDRQADLSQYSVRARSARHAKDLLLSSAVTDLVAGRDITTVAASFFYVAGTGPMGTLARRYLAVRGLLGSDSRDAIDATFAGTATRQIRAGLGFDVTRIAIGDLSGAFGKQKVDPVIESLALFGLTVLPVRGDGRRRPFTRGCSNGVFNWLAWNSCLDFAAIDALLGTYYAHGAIAPVGIEAIARFESVSYVSKSSADPTRGFATRRLS